MWFENSRVVKHPDSVFYMFAAHPRRRMIAVAEAPAHQYLHRCGIYPGSRPVPALRSCSDHGLATPQHFCRSTFSGLWPFLLLPWVPPSCPRKPGPPGGSGFRGSGNYRQPSQVPSVQVTRGMDRAAATAEVLWLNLDAVRATPACRKGRGMQQR